MNERGYMKEEWLCTSGMSKTYGYVCKICQSLVIQDMFAQHARYHAYTDWKIAYAKTLMDGAVSICVGEMR